ncbi:MAG: hypothetical protein ACP5UU_05375 [Thermoprotei archaeon]
MDIRHGKLLGVDAYAEGKGRSKAKTAAKMNAEARREKKTNENALRHSP